MSDFMSDIQNLNRITRLYNNFTETSEIQECYFSNHEDFS